MMYQISSKPQAVFDANAPLNSLKSTKYFREIVANMKKRVTSGVRIVDDHYTFDYTVDEVCDLVELVGPTPIQSAFNDNVYWFGYKFTSEASSKQRSEFIKSIKSPTLTNMSELEFDRFIKAPIANLNKIHSLYQFDFFVYPVSGRSPLVSKIIREIGHWVQRDISRISFELVKRKAQDIKFDWESFESDYFGDSQAEQQRFYQMKTYVENQLMPKIETLDYFSIAQSVPSKYRKYITNFFDVSNNADEIVAKISSSDGGSVLVVDDINTTGSTLYEILRILAKLNPSLNVYVYTLIGRES